MRFLGRALSLSATRTRLERRDPDTFLRIGILATVLAAVAAAVIFRDNLITSQAGYGAVALIVLVGSAGLVVPVPALATACTAAGFLDPALVALIAACAGTVGELTGYFLGYTGRGVIDKSRLYQRVESWMRRRGWVVLFVMAAIPNPFFDVAGIAAGALRYPLWQYLLAAGSGKLVKFFGLAYACSFSVAWMMGIFGL